MRKLEYLTLRLSFFQICSFFVCYQIRNGREGVLEAILDMVDITFGSATWIQKLHSERKESFVGAQDIPDLTEYI